MIILRRIQNKRAYLQNIYFTEFRLKKGQNNSLKNISPAALSTAKVRRGKEHELRTSGLPQ